MALLKSYLLSSKNSARIFCRNSDLSGAGWGWLSQERLVFAQKWSTYKNLGALFKFYFQYQIVKTSKQY